MISFEICVKGKPVTRFSAVRKRTETLDGVEFGIYEWASWKPGVDGELGEYTSAEVAHDPTDRVEELAYKILEDWANLRVQQAYANSPAGRKGSNG